eukprot:gene5994-8197_t
MVPTAVAAAATAWLVLCGVEDGVRFGLYDARFADMDRFHHPGFRARRCDCAAPPCAGGLLS